MNTKYPIVIVEDTFFFKKGQLLENYKKVNDGVEDVNGNFLVEGSYVMLTEKLSSDDEAKVKALIKKTLTGLLWNLYTKSSIIIPNI